MRVLLVVLFISTLQIGLKCDNEDSKLWVNSKPAGSKLSSSIGIKYAKKSGPLKKYYASHIQSKTPNELKLYTAFPPPPIKLQTTERKTRVKKVLPSYGFPLERVKRSSDGKSNLKKAGNLRKGKRLVKKRKIAKLRAKKPKKSIKRNAKPKNKKAVRKVAGKNKIGRAKKGKKKLGKNKVKNSKKPKALRTKKVNKRKNPLRKSQTKKIVDRKVRSRRLTSARDASIEDYPYAVSIQKSGEHWCSGALLNQRLVITTANCMWKAHRMSRMRIRAGSRYYDRGGQTARIQEVAKHPLWNIRSPPDNDIALLLLDRFIKFSASVHGVDLPNKAMLPAFDDAWVTSWGSVRRDGIFDETSKALQVYHVKIMNRNRCNNVTMRYGVFVTENFICFTQTGRRGPCTRDTGAPAVSDGVVWGLASWGIRKLCGTERFPAVFTYVASPSNMNFIINATHYLMSEERFSPFYDRFYQQENDSIAMT